ncbi:hypothetical protein NPIL_380151, partial [Nephila pilipes]
EWGPHHEEKRHFMVPPDKDDEWRLVKLALHFWGCPNIDDAADRKEVNHTH